MTDKTAKVPKFASEIQRWSTLNLCKTGTSQHVTGCILFSDAFQEIYLLQNILKSIFMFPINIVFMLFCPFNSWFLALALWTQHIFFQLPRHSHTCFACLKLTQPPRLIYVSLTYEYLHMSNTSSSSQVSRVDDFGWKYATEKKHESIYWLL